MASLGLLALAFGLLIFVDLSSSTFVSQQDWDLYKGEFMKSYASVTEESQARFNYAVNKKYIEKHNFLYQRGQYTYSLRVNKFTDMRLIHFNGMFPVAIQTGPGYPSPPPTVSGAPPAYNPITGFGYNFHIEDQGIKCNSGWAYAAAKSIEILQAAQTGNMNPDSLSAQNLIDCSGGATACKSQTPQTAFQYLTFHDMNLLPTSAYPNNNASDSPGMCLPKGNVFTKLAQYSTIANNDDATLLSYVGAGFPVVVEFNPTTFEFMHYGTGIYQPPKTTTKGSHFMVVVGYDSDAATGLDYWIVLNSFGEKWGQKGYIRVVRSTAVKVSKNAQFPTMLG